jgi:hypothetical protein
MWTAQAFTRPAHQLSRVSHFASWFLRTLSVSDESGLAVTPVYRTSKPANIPLW